jgi:hypothetical protein
MKERKVLYDEEHNHYLDFELAFYGDFSFSAGLRGLPQKRDTKHRCRLAALQAQQKRGKLRCMSW